MPSGTRLYKIWGSMKGRCCNPNDRDYKQYGGRGITVCNEWIDSFVVFQEWAYANGYREYLSIDRKDNNGNYEPSNCRWITIEEQNRNKSNLTFAEIGGETKTLSEWAKLYGMSHSALFRRYRRGLRGEELIKPVKFKTVEIDGVSKTFSEWCNDTGLNLSTFTSRYKSGLRGKDLIQPLMK